MGPDQTIEAAPAAPATILVVEDDDDVRELLRRTLVRAGYAVETAIHGAEGLRLFHSQSFDVVVTDVIMPEMDGFELIRALRRQNAAVNVVALSGVEPMMDFLRMAKSLGAKAALKKPVDRAQLVSAVRNLLGTTPPSAA